MVTSVARSRTGAPCEALGELVKAVVPLLHLLLTNPFKLIFHGGEHQWVVSGRMSLLHHYRLVLQKVSEQENRTNIISLHSLSVFTLPRFSTQNTPMILPKFPYPSDWVVEKCRKDPTIVTKLFHKSNQGNKKRISLDFSTTYSNVCCWASAGQ